jgi:hypothetical protein
MAEASRKSATAGALKCSLFFRKKLTGTSIRPPKGAPKPSSRIRTLR